MKYSVLPLPLLLLMLLVSCSNSTSKTSAKLKLNLGATTNAGSGIGAGGILLFGKSSTGEQFGKIISTTEQELDLPNGDWSFYAMMWTKSSSYNFNDTIYCGKSASKLSGTAVSVALNLTNAICADTDFSAGKSYTDYYGKNHMPNFVVEECDDLNAANGVVCTKDNEGSALSYRMTFRSYKKAANGVVTFEADSLSSACAPVSGGSPIFSSGMYMNFPVSTQAMPFIISAEMFLGSPDCGQSITESKGVYTQTFFNGLSEEVTPTSKKVVSTGYSCSSSTSFNQPMCDANSGYWTGSTCQFSDLMTMPFMPTAVCPGATATTTTYLKQMVAIPKEFLCRNLSINLSGSDVFPGGNGTAKRPYKICSEWQLNQIGEIYATSTNLSSAYFKLMNDLDMNVADFNLLVRPLCVGQAGSLVKKHHNLNPLDQTFVGGCIAANVVTTNSFTGNFNGNNRTIANGRIYSDVENLGFVRKLGTNGIIRNLNFKNLEVEGASHAGLIAGYVSGSNASIDNVKVKGGNVEADNLFVGGVAGEVVDLNNIKNVLVTDVKVHGQGKVGGLVGKNNGSISNSMFRGEVKQYLSTDEQVGGLVGLTGTSSNIASSFSEGHVLSYAKYSGGLVGHNMGAISNSYSTMFVQSKYASTSAFVGGITASNESGTMTNVYFDGVLKYDGGNSGSVVDGINSYAGTQNYCYSTSAVPSSSCALSASLIGTSIFAGDSSWLSGLTNSLPRLAWESNVNRSCLILANTASISNQKSAGRGTGITNPLTICSPAQLIDLGTTGVNLNAVLMDDLNLSSWTSGQLIPVNSAVFDGQKHSLMGLTITSGTAVPLGVFKNNTGKIMNLNLYGNMVTLAAPGAASSILSAVNSGTITGIKMAGNTLSGYEYVGLVTGSQSGAGIINDIVIEDSKVSGGSYVGGVVGQSEGAVSRAYVQASISQNPSVSNYHKLGGVVGLNALTGVVDQVSFGGNINFSTASTNANLYSGGIVGYNLGTLQNSLVKNYSQMTVMNSISVGGLVGLNASSGRIRTSFTTGSLIYYGGGEVPASSSFDALVGQNDGQLDAYTYFLENKTGGFLGNVTTAYACNGSIASFTNAVPPYLTYATPTANLMIPNNVYSSGDSLSTFLPINLLADYQVSYTPACASGESFNFYASYEPSIQGKKTIAGFSTLANFVGSYDIAYDDGPTSGNSINYERLMEYHKARMNGVAPTLTPPVWIFEPGEYPRLVQLND